MKVRTFDLYDYHHTKENTTKDKTPILNAATSERFGELAPEVLVLGVLGVVPWPRPHARQASSAVKPSTPALFGACPYSLQRLSNAYQL